MVNRELVVSLACKRCSSGWERTLVVVENVQYTVDRWVKRGNYRCPDCGEKAEVRDTRLEVMLRG